MGKANGNKSQSPSPFLLQKNTGYLKEQAEVQTVPIHCKVAITIKEAAEYSNTMNLYVHITEDEKHREIDLVADALKVI